MASQAFHVVVVVAVVTKYVHRLSSALFFTSLFSHIFWLVYGRLSGCFRVDDFAILIPFKI